MANSEQIEFSFEARARLLTVEQIYELQDPSWLKVIKEDRRVERKPAGYHEVRDRIDFSRLSIRIGLHFQKRNKLSHFPQELVDSFA